MAGMNGADDSVGSGGPGGGGGGAAMSYKTPSSEQGAGFIDKQIKPAGGLDAGKSVLVSVHAGTPEVDKGGAPASGALRAAKAEGGAADGQVILPEHKAVVRHYFNRTKK